MSESAEDKIEKIREELTHVKAKKEMNRTAAKYSVSKYTIDLNDYNILATFHNRVKEILKEK